jgi:hypothetical protein
MRQSHAHYCDVRYAHSEPGKAFVTVTAALVIKDYSPLQPLQETTYILRDTCERVPTVRLTTSVDATSITTQAGPACNPEKAQTVKPQ